MILTEKNLKIASINARNQLLILVVTLLCVFIVSELSMNTLRELRFVCMLSC